MTDARMRWKPPRSRIVFAASILGFLFCLPIGTPRGQEAQYAGSDTCIECHEDNATSLYRTPHGKKGFSNLSAYGCETCHGPGAKHAEDPTVEEKRPTLAKLTAADRSAQCQQCHDGGEHFFWKGGRHEARGVSCTDCHSIHSFKSGHGQLKTEREIDTCFGCHADKRADAMRASHHPVREGRMSCMDCHNPHGTASRGNLSAESVNEKCYECHTEKRGPFLWEHAPVRENCLTCHTPHGSNHQKLQRTSVPYLCQQCHSNTRHPGTLYDGTTLPGAARATNRLFNRACVNCHAAIHGSNHPSGPYLGR